MTQPTAPLETAASREATPGPEPASSPQIIGIGASAGGLAAIEAFFDALPHAAATGMAFVLVQHLDPDHKSLLPALVQPHTRMQVLKVEDGMLVHPNCVYVIPPNKDMELSNGRLHLTERHAPRGVRLPIDFFFRSLAQDQGDRAIGIVLSGTGTDGTLGLLAIKGEGGMVMAQTRESAGFDGMPRSAIGTGQVDYVLPPNKMPEQLVDYLQHASSMRPLHLLQSVFRVLHTRTRHDFSEYKQSTMQRRIARRMAVARINRFEDYVVHLTKNPQEAEALFRELLIGVTSFFRDPQAFEAIEEKVIPRLLGAAPSEAVLRVWVPACSSGEEAYSLAILFQECADNLKHNLEVKIFATDIDDAAIRKARAAVYPENIAADVSPERLARFFTHEGTAYRVHKRIRDLVVFAKQDLLVDPPFTKIDLVSCRNLLIYLEASPQKKLLQLFHYALNHDGFLFLGSSETVGGFGSLFAAIDKKWKVYQRLGAVLPAETIVPVALGRQAEAAARRPIARKPPEAPNFSLREAAERALLESHTPACVVINAHLEVLYVHGSTGVYLEPATGEASLNLLRMARPGLKLELTTAVHKANSQQVTVRRDGVHIRENGQERIVNIVVKPMSTPDAPHGLIMVLFEDVTAKTPRAAKDGRRSTPGERQRIADLEKEILAKDDYLRSVVEEAAASNEELMSANEELQSLNEELQSGNEELETSREELQSINEELVTVNAELRSNMEELARTTNDMNNLLTGTGIATMFVDDRLNIKRFTPSLTQIINLIASDVGRPMKDIASQLAEQPNLEQAAREVLNTLIPKEMEVRTVDGRWFFMRIHPYRTVENVIDGAVLTFSEITVQKDMQEQLQVLSRSAAVARDYAERVIDTLRQPLLVLNSDLEVTSANRSFCELFKTSPQATVGQSIYELGNGEWKVDEVRRLLEEVLPKDASFAGVEITLDSAAIGRRVLRLDACEVNLTVGQESNILLVIEDVTAH